MLKEFRDFIVRGNVLDLAVAVIMGAAFGKIIESLVKDIIMPPIGLILGKVDFSSLYINLSGQAYNTLKEAQDAGAATLNYGLFLNATINFIIIAAAIFLVIRAANKVKRPAPPAAPVAPTTRDCPYCCSAIAIKATRCPNCTSELI